VSRALCLLAIVVACGDNGAAPVPHSGARLQIVRYAYDDGAEQIDRTTLYDAALRERCRAEVFSDGARYCMPVAAQGETVFVDDRCTRALGLSRASATPPAYFIAYYRLGGEVRPSRIYPPGAAVDPPALVWRQQDGYCIGPTAPEPGTYFELAAALGPDALARISEARRETGDDLAIGIDTSDDGLVVASALYDLDHGPCDLVTEANVTEAACVARSLMRADYYADDECTTPLVAVPASRSGDVAAYRDPRSGCWSVASIAPAQTSGPLYERIDTSCINVQPPTGAALHALQDPVPPPALARVRSGSGARLDVIELVDGAAHVPSLQVFDRQLGADCTPQERDGEILCVPDAAVVTTTVFADDACATPIELAFVPTGECEPPARFAARGDARHPIEDPYALPFYELEPGDRCGTFAAPPGHVAHAIGAAVPAEAFARASRIQR
jgi:hypothetical protein